MSKIDLKWRILIMIILIGIGFFMVYPPWDPDGDGPKRGKINLGLDLQGGMHMVMDVKTEEAVQAELLLSKKYFESLCRKDKLKDVTIDTNNETFALSMAFSSMEDRDHIMNMVKSEGGFNVSSSAHDGKYYIDAVMEQTRIETIKDNALQQALMTIRNRVDELGVSEPIIQQQQSLTEGSMPRILVQLPGVKDIQRAKEIIGRTALLEFRIVIDGPTEKTTLLESHGGKVPKDAKLFESETREGSTQQIYYLLEKDAEVTGADLDSVDISKDEYGKYAVSFTLSRTGGKKFARLTQENMDKALAIVLDGKVQSAPIIRARISRDGQITGNFTFEEAKDLMIVLRSGALPASVVPFEERTVGPSLGHDSISQGLRAGLLGSMIVVVFMAIWYRTSGIIADIGLFITILLLLSSLASLKATLTLPGIAGIVLTIGMAVDANVLIFERIREELRQGKTIRTAIAMGYDRAFITIMDSNLTTLIAAVVLLQFGVGPIRGFAVTLSIGVVASMFSALFIARVLMDLVLANPASNKLSI